MSKLLERYVGDYQVTFSLQTDPKVDANLSTLLCKRVEIVGPPFIVKCFTKKKATAPAQVIPWERLVGIEKKEQTDGKASPEPPTEEPPAASAPRKAQPKAKAKAKRR